MNVELLYFADCPNWEATQALLVEFADTFDLEISSTKVSTISDASQRGFLGSPSIRLEGQDPFETGGESVGLACRIYQTEDGLAGAPTRDMLMTALIQSAKNNQ